MNYRTKGWFDRELKRLIKYQQAIQKYCFTNNEYGVEARQRVKEINFEIELVRIKISNFK